MIQVADRLDDPAGVESVILSLPSYISEAMNTMMENIASINSKVRTHTGTRIQVETMWSAFTVHLKKTSNDTVSWATVLKPSSTTEMNT